MTDSEDVFEKALHAFEKSLYPGFENNLERDHPNPDRIGCPDHSFLERAGTAPYDLSDEEKAMFVEHFENCWPCFKEIKRLRQSARDRKRQPQ